MGCKQVRMRLWATSFLALTVSVSSLIMAGCSSSSENNKVVGEGVATSGKGEIYSLQKKGVSVYRIGEHVMITIPSSLLFKGYSSTLLDSANTTLSMVAKIIEPIAKISVNITAYSAAAEQSQKDLVVTNKQAQNVAHRLQRLGVDARLISSAGMGGGHLVSVSEKGLSAGSINSRVVITLRDLSDH